MGYTVVSRTEVPPAEGRPCELRRLSEAAAMSNVAVNVFRAEPGEQIPLAYHYHEQQEEAFYVLSGTMFVETPDETYRVESGSLFTASPKSPHRAYNPQDADDDVEVLAIGAPAIDGDANEYQPGTAPSSDEAGSDEDSADAGSDEDSDGAESGEGSADAGSDGGA